MPFTQNYQKQSVLVKTTTYQSCLVLLPRDASTALAVMQCLSVCLSVRHIRESKRGIKTNKDIFEIFHHRIATPLCLSVNKIAQKRVHGFDEMLRVDSYLLLGVITENI